jgi:signal transduction histidine kinase
MEELFVSEIGAFVSGYDWSQTPLGAVETWSSELKIAVQILVAELDRTKTLQHKNYRWYQGMFESTGQGFCICEMLFDAQGQATDYRFLEINDAFEAMTGLEQAEGKTARELVPDLEDIWFETYGRVVLTGKSVRFEHESSIMNRWFDVNAFPVEPPHEHRFGILFTEISDRKRAEATLKQSEENYRHLIEKVQSRNQELDNFSHIVSHDLKAPLRAISHLAQWLEDDLGDKIPSENQLQLQLMRSRADRMEALINGLLSYAHITREDMPLELVSVEELLAEIIDSLDPLPPFTIEISPPLPTFATKRLLLNQVLTNLISNAIKHHDRADGKVKITVQDHPNRPEFYEFAIADDGQGIDPQQQTRIFDIFQTLETQDKSPNAGIGLAIVKKIVEAEGNEIYVKSEIGKGSTFYFTWRKFALDLARS